MGHPFRICPSRARDAWTLARWLVTDGWAVILMPYRYFFLDLEDAPA